MIDHSAEPLNPAEATLAIRIQRWSDHGVVAIDAAAIASRAASDRTGRTARVWTWSKRRSRTLTLGLAVLLLLTLALALAGAARLLRADADSYRAVVVRQVDGGAVDVVLAAADGSEHVLRHLTSESLGIDARYTLGSSTYGQSMNQQGWLEIRADGTGADRTGLERNGLVVLIDLADPSRAPIIQTGNGFMSGQWGPNGEYALFFGGSTDLGQVRVLDLDRGIDSEIIVPAVQTFGGGPDILWAADGSGFLARQGTVWGVTPLDGGPFRPGVPKLLSRGTNLLRPDLEDPGGWTVPGGDSGLAPATPVTAYLAAGGEAIWQLLDDPTGPSPRALLARLTGPGAVESVRAFQLPAGPARSFTLSPDDTFVAIHVDGASGDWDSVLAPVGGPDTTVVAGPVVRGTLAGLVPATRADSWPGL